MSMLPYVDLIQMINNLEKIYTWDDMQPLHRNENCENIREREAARLKERRIGANAEKENDNTKCMILAKIQSLTEAIQWRELMRDFWHVNANSVCLGSVLKVNSIPNEAEKSLVRDLIVTTLRHNVHPFSLKEMGYNGLTEDIVDDIIEYCQTGNVTKKPAKTLTIRVDENLYLQDLLSKWPPLESSEISKINRIMGKLQDRRRYVGWIR